MRRLPAFIAVVFLHMAGLVSNCQDSVSEVVAFMRDNGMAHVTVRDHGAPALRDSLVRKAGGDFYLRVDTGAYLDSGENEYVVHLLADPASFSALLDPLANATVLKSLVVICIDGIPLDESENILRGTLSGFKKNSLFYLALLTSAETRWKQVMSLQSGYTWSSLKFLQEGSFQVKEDYDLGGLTVTSISLSWEPFMIMKGCDESGLCTQSYGFIMDLLDILAQRCNFIHLIYKYAWLVEPAIVQMSKFVIGR